ncbi:MAG: type II toxin-antitoxin system RelE/ParE family toxin [Chitinophagales bacterium]
MDIKILESFSEKLNSQIKYIARDKPAAARKFKNGVLQALNSISKMPYKNRKSIYFDDNEISDLIFKGYKIVYRINKSKNQIEVFGFVNFQNTLK